MNDYIQQLKEYKEKTWKAHRTSWSESDVRTLIETGKCEGHSDASCRCMLSKLRSDPALKNKFCGLVHEFGDKLGESRKYSKLDKEEIELINRHIVPYGREVCTCAAYATYNKLTDRTNRQPWSFESKKEYEARIGKAATETVKEPVKEEPVEVKPQTEFELHAEAIKTMVSGGMEVEKIMKLLNIDETTFNAFMHLMTKYNF